MTGTDGYEAEPTEVDAVLAAFVGDQGPDEDDDEWLAHLSSRLALLTAAAAAVSAQRDALVAAMLAEPKVTERALAERLGLSPTRPGQLARRAWQRPTDPQWVERVTAARHYDWETECDGGPRVELRAAPDKDSIVTVPSVWWDDRQWVLRTLDGTDTPLGIRNPLATDRAFVHAARALGRITEG